MNLVLSTTVGWNIGDQFIFMGVRELLRSAWGTFSVVIHDRNPVKLMSGGVESHKVIACGWADALVIAGSPGWTTECAEIYRTALDHKVPIYLIGIGAGAPLESLADEVAGNPDIVEALHEAALVICRDEVVRDVVGRHREDHHLLACPASYSPHPLGTPVGPVGALIALGPHYEGDWGADRTMAHQIADLERSEGKAFYSEDPQNYLARYAGASHVTSSRLHASVVCRAMGVPVTNLWPDDDFRCATAWSVIESLPDSRPDYWRLLARFTPKINKQPV